MLERIARLAVAAPRRIIVAAALLAVLIGAFGIPVADKLSPSGFQDPTAESSRATKMLSEKFGRGDVPLVLVVTAPDRYDSELAWVVRKLWSRLGFDLRGGGGPTGKFGIEQQRAGCGAGVEYVDGAPIRRPGFGDNALFNVRPQIDRLGRDEHLEALNSGFKGV